MPSKQLRTFLFLTEPRWKIAEAAPRILQAAFHGATHASPSGSCSRPAPGHCPSSGEGKSCALFTHFYKQEGTCHWNTELPAFLLNVATPSFVAFYMWKVVYILPRGVGSWSIRTMFCDFSWILGRVMAFARLRAHTQSTDVGEKNG